MRKAVISCVTDLSLRVDESMTVDEIISKSIAQWSKLIDKVLPDHPDLIVLPEVCDRPDIRFISLLKQKELITKQSRAFLDNLRRTAIANKTYIAYPTYSKDECGNFFNSLHVIDRKGELIGTYNKNFLVTEENTELGLQYATTPLVLALDFGRVGFVICFDLNFLELLGEYKKLNPELMVFSSEYHGGLMQNYWAYTLGSYFAGCIRPPALSTIVSPLGEVIAHTTNYFTHITKTINLDFFVIHLDGHWDKLEAMKLKYGEGVTVYDPGNLASVLISIESEQLSAAQLIEEFKFKLLDEYLDGVRKYRNKYLMSI
jgi:predicted amidohydrolase